MSESAVADGRGDEPRGGAMRGLLGWWKRLLIEDDDGFGESDGLTVVVGVGSEAEPGAIDLALEAGTAERAAAMLRELARLGTVGRIWLSLAPDLSEAETRLVLRQARRLRGLGVRVDRWSGDE
jgi:hypothetical protein